MKFIIVLLKKIRDFLEKKFDMRITGFFPFGYDLFRDIRKAFPEYEFKLIFDVGANIGQSAREFAAKAPTASIYCFEPSSSTFEKLKTNLTSIKNIFFNQLAFSEKEGKMKISNEENSLLNKLYEINYSDDKVSEVVDVDTIDNFCKKNNIDRIGLLKIDTEGNDFKVLKSAKEMLRTYSIDFVNVETGINPSNELHVPFEVIKKFMEENNYHLFGIYDQVHEWKTGSAVLRRVNPVFVSSRLIVKQ